MTVSLQTPINQHTANGVTTVFAYTFKILDADDLTVYLDDVETISGFTVAGVGGESGGTVTFSSAPASGVIVSLIRDMDLIRETDYQNSGDFLSETVNTDFDRIWMAIQQQNRILERRALLFDEFEVRTETLNRLPTPEDGKVMYWEGGALVNGALRDLASDVDFADAMKTFPSMEALRISTGNDDFVTVNRAVSGGPVVNMHLYRDGTGTPTTAPNIFSDLADGIFTNTASNTYNLSEYQALSSLAFSAKGDGTTTDTVAVQNACDFSNPYTPQNFFGGSGYKIGAIELTDGAYLADGKLILAGSAAGFELSGNITGVKFVCLDVTGDGVAANLNRLVWTDQTDARQDALVFACRLSSLIQAIDLGKVQDSRVIANIVNRAVGTSPGQGYGTYAGGLAKNYIAALNIYNDCDRHGLYSAEPNGQVAVGNIYRDHGNTAGGGGTSRAAHAISRGHDLVAIGEVFVDTHGIAMTIDDDDSIAGYAENFLVASCLFRNTDGTDIRIGCSNPGADTNVKSVKISGTIHYPKATQQNGFIGVLSGHSVAIEGAHFYAPAGTVSSYFAISLVPDAGIDSDFSNLSIKGCTGVIDSSGSSAFVVIGSELCAGVADIVIEGNTIDTKGNDPIYYAAVPTNPNIKHDYVHMKKDVTLSAGSQTLNVAGYYRFVITGNGGGSTVTNLVNGYDGKVVELIFQDANTTISNANIYLDGAASLVSALRKRVKLKYENGAWFQYDAVVAN